MEQTFLSKVKSEAETATRELVKLARLESGDVMVVGCSSSEVTGGVIGTSSSEETAIAVFEGIYGVLKEQGIYLATQCCEHLNRAIIIEKGLAKRERLPIVNVVPQPKAGGSWSTTAYKNFEHAVAVEHIQADAGMDIGDTLIGMHLKEVAVPVRLSIGKIGEAHLVCARTRGKFIGGERAVYADDMK